MANLNPAFEAITEIIQDVDIIKIQKSLGGIAVGNISDKIVNSSGVKFLNSVLKKILQPYSEKYFVEYALLPSTLDPENEQLFSMTAIQENKTENQGEFKDLIENHVKNIINHLYHIHEDNFFHNPETFLAPKKINIVHSFSNQVAKETRARNKSKLIQYENKLKVSSGEIPNKYFTASDNLYFSNMTYNRKFDDIILSAKSIYDANDGKTEKMDAHYRNGASDLRYFYDRFIKKRNEIACYITFPIVSSSSEDFPAIYKQVFGNKLKGRLQGMGVCFIYFILKSKHAFSVLKKHENISKLEADLFIEINNIIRTYTYNQVFNIGLRLYERAKENSIKSAIGAIMARNMSHNLGSHVFYYTRNEIDSLSHSGGQHNETFKGLSYFLQYVQERQDFIASITSQEPQAFGPFNLKANVFDLITPDAHEKRHQSEPSPTNFLLKYITFSEGLTRSEERTYSNIEIILKKEGFEFSSWPPSYNREAYDENISKFYDIDFSVQGGQNSSHAFLIIVENIIRNAAKHGRRSSSKDNLNITIEVTRKKTESIIQIYDNCKNGREAVPFLNAKLKSLYIINENDGGSINKDSKGLKEIIVCVGWLKGMGYRNVFKDSNIGVRDNVLTIQNYGGNLCYAFRLPNFNLCMPVSDVNATIRNILKRKHNSFASFYECSNIDDFNKLSTYLPRCILKQKDIKENSVWKRYFENSENITRTKIKSSKDILIFFERDFTGQSGNFIFCKNDAELTKKINECNQQFIIFKNHLSKNRTSVIEYFIGFEDELKPDVINNRISVESISGSNYSFNLLQRALQKVKTGLLFDEDLYYRILEAYLTPIVIVDERLCPEKLTLDSLAKELSVSVKTSEWPDKRILEKYMKSHIQNHFVELQKQNSADKVLEYTQRDDFKKDLKAEVLSLDQQFENRLLKLKNIYLFNLDPKEFYMIDYEGKLFFEDVFDNLKVNPKFISIHIGILDKISREAIARDESYRIHSKDDDKNTLSILSKLQYLKHRLSIPDTTYVAVHSGRGGLNEIEQGITFIPFTSLQSSYENCKFVLSELFYNQVYFPIKKEDYV